MFPSMSFLTGLKATDPRISGERHQPGRSLSYRYDTDLRILELFLPKSLVSDSAASKKSVVLMALSFSLLTWTSTKDFFMVSRKVAMTAVGSEQLLLVDGEDDVQQGVYEARRLIAVGMCYSRFGGVSECMYVCLRMISIDP
jgi:hypothetical protein